MIFDYFAGFVSGLAVGFIFWFIEFYRRRKFEEKLKSWVLAYDLDCNLNFINENIIRIKRLRNGMPIDGFSYLDDEVLLSVINSHKIALLKKNTIQYLLAFNNKVKMVNNSINKFSNLNDLANDFVLGVLRGARFDLKEIFKELHKSGWWEKNQLEGLNGHKLGEEERIELL